MKIKMKKGTSKRKRKITWKMIDEMMRPSEKKIDEAVQKAMVEMFTYGQGIVKTTWDGEKVLINELLDEFKQEELKK